MDKYVFFIDPDRIGSVIGRKGRTKRFLEREFDCKIKVDSNSGRVEVVGDDFVNEYVLWTIINAISFGHNPDEALLLENEYVAHDFIDLKEYVKKDKIGSVLGRVIGRNGSVRRIVEEITGCDVVVHKHYISFIGPFENTYVLREAFIKLIKGASHSSFYRYLERNKKDVI